MISGPWRRTGQLAVATVLALAGLTGFSSAANTAAGTFTIGGGHTHWSFDTGKPIAVTGTTTEAQTGPVTLQLDGATVATTTEDNYGRFTFAYTLPDTTCADGEANTHTVDVTVGGAQLGGQQLLYRCASYAAAVEFDNNQNLFRPGINWGVYASQPFVAACIQATDTNSGDYLGQVLETGAPPSTLTVTETQPDGNYAPVATTLTWLGPAYSDVNAAGCYLYGSSPGGNSNSLEANSSAALSATLGTTTTTGPTAELLTSRILDAPVCAAAGTSIAVSGRYFDAFKTIQLNYGLVDRTQVTSTVTSDGEGTFSTTVPIPAGTTGTFDVGTATYVNAGDANPQVLDSHGVDVTVPCTTVSPAMTTTPASWAQPPDGNAFSDVNGPYRVVEVSASQLDHGPDSNGVSLSVNGNLLTVYDQSGRPVKGTPVDGNGDFSGYVHITADDAPCTQVNLLTLNVASLAPHVVRRGHADASSGLADAPIPPAYEKAVIPLDISCPVVENPALAHPGHKGDETFTNLHGYDLGTPVTVDAENTSVFGSSQVPGTGTVTSTPIDEGFSQAFLPTAGLSCGSVTQLTGTEVADTAAYSAPPTAGVPLVSVCDGDPTLTSTPATFAASSGTRTVSLRGAGLRPGSTQDLRLDGTEAVMPSQATVGPDGTITVSVPTTNLACGGHTIAATNDDPTGDDLPATALFTVTCPTAVLTPAAFDVENLPSTVVVNGDGFDADTPVTITLPSGDTTTSTTDQVGSLSTPTGNFYNPETPGVTVPLGTLPCGTGVAQVTETQAGVTPAPTAAAPFVVRCPDPPTLTVTPMGVATTSGDRQVVIDGRGWTGDTSLPLTFDGAPLTPAAVDDGGGFELVELVHAPAVGAHTIVALQPPYRSGSTILDVTQPRLTATPSSFSRDHSPPTSLAVSGTGFDPGFAVDLTVPGQATQALLAGPTGTITATVPESALLCGQDQQLSAAEPVLPGAPFTVGPLAAAPLSIACPGNPTLLPSPTGFAYTPSGHAERFTGAGFRPGTAVTVTGDGLTPTTVTTDSTGGFVLPLQMTASCGVHQVIAKPSIGYTAAVTVTVTCPTLTSAPGSYDGLHLPGRVTVAGTGYDPSSLVTVALEQTGQHVVDVIVRAGGNGGFTTSLPASALVCGTLPVAGTEKVPTGTPPTASVIDAVTCATPTLTVGPAVVGDGEAPSVTGRNFHPGEVVTLTWLLADGTPGLGRCSAVAKPDTTIATSCLVFDHDALGERTLVALDTKGGTAGAPLLVVANSTEPGRSASTAVSLLARR